MLAYWKFELFAVIFTPKMQYKNILGYLEEVQATIQSNPGSIADYDLRQIADLYEIAKKKDYKEARKVESTFAMNARQLKVELGAKMSRTAKSPL